MQSIALLWLPLACLAVLVACGLGLATLLGPRRSPLGNAALAAPLAAAVIACVSPLIYLGVPLRLILAAVVGALAVLTIRRRRRASEVVNAMTRPALIAVVAVVLAAVPWLARDNWEAATFGNADPYYWVSQAKTFLDGPPPTPSERYPDRESLDKVLDGHWPVALPSVLGGVALVGRQDPVEVYGAFAVLITALLALAVFFCAHEVLGWSSRATMAVSLLAGANAWALFTTHYGWQAQIALTVFGTLAVFTLRLALDEGAGRTESVVTALFAAAGTATYGVVFLLSFSGIAAASIVAFVVARRSRDAATRAYRVVRRTLLYFAVLGVLPIVAAILNVIFVLRLLERADWGSQGWARGIPADAIGLVPRILDLGRPPSLWTGLAMAVTVALGVFALIGLRQRAGTRSDVLAGTAVFVLATSAAMLLPTFDPYLSVKMIGYGLPVLLLLAVYGVFTPVGVGRRAVRLLRASAVTIGLLLAVASTATVTWNGVDRLQGSLAIGTMRPALEPVAADAPVIVDVRNAWRQSWIMYYLRDRPTLITSPYETNKVVDVDAFAGLIPRYVVEADTGQEAVVWRGEGVVVRLLRPGGRDVVATVRSRTTASASARDLAGVRGTG